MGTISRIAAALVVVMVAVTGCGDDSPGNDIVSISEPYDGTTVRLGPADRLDITLEGNPATGYSWTTLTIDNAVLRQVGEPTFGDDAGLLGSRVPVTFHYECVAPGETLLELGYLRPFEDAPPLDRFSVTVIAQ